MAQRITYEWLRDYVGYSNNPPDPQWPGSARIALNFNLNYETGGEANILDGDPASEGMLNDIGFPPVPGKRNPLVESAFEYGSRVGVWRVLRIFAKFDIPLSVLGVATALERNPEVARAFVAGGHEIVSHGYRWIDYHYVDEAVEREHMRRAVATTNSPTGSRLGVSHIWSFPTPTRPTIIAAIRATASHTLMTSCSTCGMPSTCCMRKVESIPG